MEEYKNEMKMKMKMKLLKCKCPKELVPKERKLIENSKGVTIEKV